MSRFTPEAWQREPLPTMTPGAAYDLEQLYGFASLGDPLAVPSLEQFGKQEYREAVLENPDLLTDPRDPSTPSLGAVPEWEWADTDYFVRED